MDELLTTIQRLVETAKGMVREDQPQLSEHGVRGRAIEVLMAWERVNNQALLYLMREMEMHQSYRSPDNGSFEDLRSWAYAKLERFASHETLVRLSGATLSLIAPLDAEPMITSDGEKIDGLAIITQASASSGLIRHVRHSGRQAPADCGRAADPRL
jgi:hypothetical protein